MNFVLCFEDCLTSRDSLPFLLNLRISLSTSAPQENPAGIVLRIVLNL